MAPRVVEIAAPHQLTLAYAPVPDAFPFRSISPVMTFKSHRIFIRFSQSSIIRYVCMYVLAVQRSLRGQHLH